MQGTTEDRRTFTLGDRTFVLDAGKAEAALAATRVVGGRVTHAFNLLPLRYVHTGAAPATLRREPERRRSYSARASSSAACRSAGSFELSSMRSPVIG